MKSIEQIQREIPYGDVMTREKFIEIVEYGGFIPYDGDGYFHDGEQELENQNVWMYTIKQMKTCPYPYVIWYNK